MARTLYAAVNKRQKLVVSPEGQIFDMPEEGLTADYTFLYFGTEEDANRAASMYVSPKFKVVPVEC